MATAERISIDESHCVLCWDDMDYSACGSCDHPICLKCCVKLRLLRKENDCPVCRAQLKEVIVSKGYKSWADKSTRPLRRQHARNYGILHETPESQAKVDELLAHRCPECDETFRSFPQVKDHVRKVHSLIYCDICLRNLKIFTHERKCYTREALVRHRKEGDEDDRSHRGHPLCAFCDERYLDNDELLAHLRKNHFWCHICEKDGSQDYYPNYKDLRKHFKQAHFLCEEGDCLNEQFTSVFRRKVDYQAHISQKHSDRLSKAEARQMRTLDVNITFNPRENPDSSAAVVSGRDYSFPDQGNRDRSRMPRIATGRQSPFDSQQRDPGLNRPKEKDRNKKESQRFQEKESGSNRKTVVDVKDSEGHRGAKGNNRSPREVLEGDHKRPPGKQLESEMNNKRISDNSKSSKVDDPVKKSKKSMKVESNDEKDKNDKGKKKDLLDKGFVKEKGKQKAMNEASLNASENKSDAGVSKAITQKSNEKGSDEKKDKKSNNNKKKEKETLKNNSLETNADSLSPEKSSDVEQASSTSASNIDSSANLDEDFPALRTDKKPEPTVNIARPKPTYDSEFPSLSDESRSVSASIRPPPGLSIPPGFGSKIIKPVTGQVKPEDSYIASKPSSNLYKTNTVNEQPSGKAVKPEKPLTEKTGSKKSIPNAAASKRTYDSEFPTLSTLTNGDRTSSGVKVPPGLSPPGLSPPGLAPPGFNPNIPVRPPPGMGWSVPMNMGRSTSKETRNQKLINDVRRILNMRGESFETFRQVSGCYRQGKTSAEKYYQQCCELLGEDHIHKIFRELIELLPDEDKQRQLLLVYNDAKVKAKLGNSVKTDDNDVNSNREPTEIARVSNGNGLVNQQPLEDDFPALPEAAGRKSKATGNTSNVWTRGGK